MLQKNVIWLLKKLGEGRGFERASFCLKCAIYLSERMHIVSIYTSRTHFATGWRAQKLRELITFLLLFIK